MGTELAGDGPDPIGHMDLVARLEDRDRAKGLSTPGTSTSLPPIRSRRDFGARSHAKTCSRSSSTCLRRTPPTSPTSSCRPPSFLESDDLVVSYFHQSLSAQVKATEPLERSRSRIRRSSGASPPRWAIASPSLHEPDHEVNARCSVAQVSGLHFAELARRGRYGSTSEPRPQFADLRFPTPSGRVEIASARAEADGQPRVPASVRRPQTTGRVTPTAQAQRLRNSQ